MDEAAARLRQQIRADYEVFAGLHGKSVEVTINLGRGLYELKRQLKVPHSARDDRRWLTMFDPKAVPNPLPFGADKAAMLIKIARSKVLTNPDICRNLPASWTTLYRLARLAPELLAAALARGAVHPQMTANDVRKLKPSSGARPGEAFLLPEDVGRRVQDLVLRAADCYLRHRLAGEEPQEIEDVLRRFADGLYRVADYLKECRARREELPAAGVDALAEMLRTRSAGCFVDEQAVLVVKHLLDGQVCGDTERKPLAEVFRQAYERVPPSPPHSNWGLDDEVAVAFATVDARTGTEALVTV